MKFLKKDTLSSLLIGLLITISSSAVLAAGGAGKADVESPASHKMEQPKHQEQKQHQKGKGEQSGEAEQVQTKEQTGEQVEITTQGAE